MPLTSQLKESAGGECRRAQRGRAVFDHMEGSGGAARLPDPDGVADRDDFFTDDGFEIVDPEPRRDEEPDCLDVAALTAA